MASSSFWFLLGLVATVTCAVQIFDNEVAATPISWRTDCGSTANLGRLEMSSCNSINDCNLVVGENTTIDLTWSPAAAYDRLRFYLGVSKIFPHEEFELDEGSAGPFNASSTYLFSHKFLVNETFQGSGKGWELFLVQETLQGKIEVCVSFPVNVINNFNFTQPPNPTTATTEDPITTTTVSSNTTSEANTTTTWSPPSNTTTTWSPPSNTTTTWSPPSNTTTTWSPPSNTTTTWSPPSNTTTTWSPPSNTTTTWSPPSNTTTTWSPPSNTTTTWSPPSNTTTTWSPPSNTTTTWSPPSNTTTTWSPPSNTTTTWRPPSNETTTTEAPRNSTRPDLPGTTPSSGGGDFECTAVGVFPDPKDCTAFHNCQYDDISDTYYDQVLTCPPPLVYCARIENCDWEQDCPCDS